MLNVPGNEENNEENKEMQEKEDFEIDTTLNVLEELEKETKMLYDEKVNLLDVEEKLWLKINEEIENKKRKKEQLKREVEELKKRCEELTKLLNALI